MQFPVNNFEPRECAINLESIQEKMCLIKRKEVNQLFSTYL